MLVSNLISQRFIVLAVRAVKVIMAIFAIAFLAAACPLVEEEHDDTGFIPVGEWSDGWDTGYNITNSSVEYYSPDFGSDFPAQTFTATIERAVDFAEGTGVLIIKINKQENMDLTIGRFTGVYYKEYNNNHVYLANPIGPAPHFAPIEASTLNNALALFNAGNMSTHVTFWGTGYTK
jgi:hypothetical protein